MMLRFSSMFSFQFLFLLSLCLPTLARPTPAQIEQLKDDMLAAGRAFEEGRWREAELLFSTLERDYPFLWQASYNLALACSKLGELECSERALSRALPKAATSEERSSTYTAYAKYLARKGDDIGCVMAASEGVTEDVASLSALRQAVSCLVAVASSSSSSTSILTASTSVFLHHRDSSSSSSSSMDGNGRGVSEVKEVLAPLTSAIPSILASDNSGIPGSLPVVGSREYRALRSVYDADRKGMFATSLRILLLETRLAASRGEEEKRRDALSQMGLLLISNSSYISGYNIAARGMRGMFECKEGENKVGRRGCLAVGRLPSSVKALASFVMAAGRAGEMAKVELIFHNYDIKNAFSKYMDEGNRFLMYPFHAYEITDDPILLRRNADNYVMAETRGVTALPFTLPDSTIDLLFAPLSSSTSLLNMEQGRAGRRRLRVGLFSSTSFSSRTTTSRLLTAVFEQWASASTTPVSLFCLIPAPFRSGRADEKQARMERVCEKEVKLYATASPSSGSGVEKRGSELEEGGADMSSPSFSFPALAMAEIINAERLPVCIDLSSLTLHPQPQLWSYRPCLVQINFHGYPGSVSARMYDFYIGDRVVAPPEYAPHFFAENLIFTPPLIPYLMGGREVRGGKEGDVDMREQSMQSGRQRSGNDTAESVIAGVDKRLSFSSSTTVMCMYHQVYKLSLPLVSKIGKVLDEAVTQSSPHLDEEGGEGTHSTNVAVWILLHSTETESQVRDVFPSHLQSYLIFSPLLREDVQWAAKERCDVHIDADRYNGHTTSYESLLHHIPIVTTPAENLVQRVTSSLLVSAQLAVDERWRRMAGKGSSGDSCSLHSLILRSSPSLEKSESEFSSFFARTFRRCREKWREQLASIAHSDSSLFSPSLSASALHRSVTLTVDAFLSSSRHAHAQTGREGRHENRYQVVIA
uniref:O-GlcNAc transferase C-terminal domain-containing protein n=1 Tax=Palpitomonas bilix TaxID=652834 RepID=A0A7S3D851_9EUKA|mmetsp:Transcript_26224/g.66684  ORF Transcript_26224/g.66684 Transcript_26224/m.66684 type:complete len:929 (+) Transcript_26224:218-3004(+)